MFTPLKLISIFACILIVIGYLNRSRRRVHIPLMACAFVIDLSIVLYLEIARDVIASAKAKMGPLMIVHIFLSCSVLALYAGQIITGIQNARGRRSRWHPKGARWFLLARFGNLITSFLVT